MKIEIVRVQMNPVTKSRNESVYDGIANPVHSCTTPDGVVHRGNNCVYDAARHLIARGTDPKTPLRVYRGDVKILTGTVDGFARLAWGGRDVDPATRPWRPNHLGGPMPPALAAWFEAWRG